MASPSWSSTRWSARLTESLALLVCWAVASHPIQLLDSKRTSRVLADESWSTHINSRSFGCRAHCDSQAACVVVRRLSAA